MTVERSTIRRIRRESDRRTAVFDDDPTGSQSVYDVSIVTTTDATDLEDAFQDPESTCFILTNTRSMPSGEAVAVDRRAARAVFEIERRLGTPFDVVSRSDSTLRGHVIDEVVALDAERREVLGSGFDGVLLAPAYFEAGRFTRDDVHYATVAGSEIPVGATEFARDATFGFTASNLKDFVVEKSGGRVDRDDVLSIGLDDIRSGGAERVAEILSGANDLQFVVVNATSYDDLDVVALGLLRAEALGKRFVHRTGPSFVQSLLGLEPRGPLRSEEIWAEGRPAGHGLVAIGSHVQQTVRQMAIVAERGGVTQLELDVARIVDPTSRSFYLDSVAANVRELLAHSDVLLYTSRGVVTGATGEASLEIARLVSASLTDVVRAALGARPAWVIAKGGITSHDIAVRSLGIRRATVLGQLLPGMISVVRAEIATESVIGMPYVVFAGNVGGDEALANAIDFFGGHRDTMAG